MTQLLDKIDDARKFLEDEASRDRAYTSSFWQSILDKRVNFPGADELESFLRTDSAAGYGTVVGDDPQLTFEKLVRTFSPDTPIEFLRKFSDPEFGGAQKFAYDGVNASITFLQNVPTTFKIQNLPLKSNLRVLEIGAGFGAVAYQLHQILDIRKYTIVDLPESLYISYFYLSENLERRSAFSARENISKGLEFATPGHLDKIDDSFDLIINTISLGEMDMSMVESYKELIRERLADDAYFISINTHGKAGITKPSDYLIDGLKVYSIEPWIRRAPNHFFNTLHYEIVQTKNDGEEIDAELRTRVDYQGCLIKLGCRMPIGKAEKTYERGIKEFAFGDKLKARELLEEALDLDIRGFAGTVARMILLCMHWTAIFGRFDEHRKAKILMQAPILEDDVEIFLGSARVTRKRIKTWLQQELELIK
jgi:hypothetical protein